MFGRFGHYPNRRPIKSLIKTKGDVTMKKLLSMITIGALVLSIGTTAFAMKNETESTKSLVNTHFVQVQERISARQAQVEEKKQEVQDFRAAAQEKSAILKAARDENKVLAQEVTSARKELTSIYTEMKTNGITLDVAVLEQLSGYSQQVRTMIDELMASKGSIQTIIDSNKEALKALDYALLDSMYAEIFEIQNWRNDQLTEINNILGEMLELVK